MIGQSIYFLVGEDDDDEKDHKKITTPWHVSVMFDVLSICLISLMRKLSRG